MSRRTHPIAAHLLARGAARSALSAERGLAWDALGLDVYAGSLTRYHAGAWSTIVDQTEEAGVEVRVSRADDLPADSIHDPEEVLAVVLSWREQLGTHLGIRLEWPEGIGTPYDTDELEWDGYGAVQLLAAYEVHPDLQPKRGWFRGDPRDDPSLYPDAAAYQAAVARPETTRYPTLMFSTEWFLPGDLAGRVFEAQGPHRRPVVMAGLDALAAELEDLNDRTLQLNNGDVEQVRRRGPGDTSSVGAMAPFGLAVLLDLARFAVEHRCPMLLDY